ncbi:transient receptor potential cation channel subfamily V member 3-like isoform X2 [Heterodontus francisci]|uniref:transient receptor potential cation channel subfamily V member 3-like isoform X2 n=1 Tax=Heterodontus francisci TaxID=7792 RepID=UPI00355C74F7
MDINFLVLLQPDTTDGETQNKQSLKRDLRMKLFCSIAAGDMETFDKLMHIFQVTRMKLTELWLIGQTALHIAIERRCPDIVRFLLEKGADVNAKANGKFFRLTRKHHGFYFGEVPLALAACTNQPEIVTLLMDNPETKIGEQDSRGNTVLHTLVTVADDTEDNTKFVIEMYNKILIKYKENNLEEMKNGKGLTPLQLAAKQGKFEIFRNILGREMKDKQHMKLSRKITDWAYGPVSSSLYNITGVDTFEENSVLKIVVFNTKIQNRHMMLSVEPLSTLLEQKWQKFAAYMFIFSCFLYMSYIIAFTAIYYDQSQPNKTTTTSWQLAGRIFISSWAGILFIMEIVMISQLRLSDLQSIMTDAWFHILFFLQAGLVAFCTVFEWIGVDLHLAFQVGAMTLGWINILYYTRGFQTMGIYSVMLQKIMLTDVVRFLFVYLLFLVGFAAALASLIEGCSNNATCSSFDNFNTAVLELFKLTIGLGDLEIQSEAKYPQLFLILLVIYVVLTFILLLNMLIALMGETVEHLSKESKNIWKLQRARTILNFENVLPKCLKEKFQLGEELYGKRYIRIKEVNWTKWSTTLARIHEDPGEEDQEESVDESADETDSMPSRKDIFKKPLRKNLHRKPRIKSSRKWNLDSSRKFGGTANREIRLADLESEVIMVSEQDMPPILETVDCKETDSTVKPRGDTMI